MTGPNAPRGRHAGRDATSALLDQVMYRPVDVGSAGGFGRFLSPVGVRLAIGVVLGAVTVAAVTSLRTPQPAEVSARALLVEQIRERATYAEELSTVNQELSGEISQLQAALLATADPGLVAGLEQTELISGAVAVGGPGLVVELDDPDVDPAELSAEARVQDVDIQIVVNGLRAAGAEAVAVNGYRLTATSAIRGAGQAVLVDLSPLVGPYRVEAIGDVRSMQTAFARSTAADHLSLLTGTYGISTSVRVADDLRLAGATTTALRYATLPDDVTSSVPPDEEGTS